MWNQKQITEVQDLKKLFEIKYVMMVLRLFLMSARLITLNGMFILFTNKKLLQWGNEKVECMLSFLTAEEQSTRVVCG